MQVPNTDLPTWITHLVTLVLGAGGVAWLRIVLENRRLMRKDFRETLLERVRELEQVVARLQTRMGSMREEMGHLEAQNEALLRENKELIRERGPAND